MADYVDAVLSIRIRDEVDRDKRWQIACRIRRNSALNKSEITDKALKLLAPVYDEYFAKKNTIDGLVPVYDEYFAKKETING